MPDNDTIQKVVQTTFQLRRGNAEEWFKEIDGEIKSPILKDGEPGFERDTYRLKIGDGTTPWANLPYIGGTGGNVTANDIINIITNSNNLQNKIIDVANSGAVTTNNLANIIANSSDVKDTIIDIIQQENTAIRFKGEAISADIDGDNIITLYKLVNGNLTEIIPSAGDVYLYQGNEYVYDGAENSWVLLNESDYNSTEDFVTQDEFQALTAIFSNPSPATINKLGAVKSSTAINTIAVAADGTMTLNTVGVDKLTVPTGVELVLDGGSATELNQ